MTLDLTPFVLLQCKEFVVHAAGLHRVMLLEVMVMVLAVAYLMAVVMSLSSAAGP